MIANNTKPVLFVLVAASTMSSSAQESENTAAYNMAVITDGPWGEFKAIERRYAFILPRLRDLCSDVDTDSFVSDMLFTIHKHIKEAGLGRDESPLQFTENIYSIVSLSSPYVHSSEFVKLNKVLAMYVTLREGGMSQKEAKDGVKELIIAFNSSRSMNLV